MEQQKISNDRMRILNYGDENVLLEYLDKHEMKPYC